MSNTALVCQSMREQLLNLGVSAHIDSIPAIMQMAVNLSHIRWFLDTFDNQHPPQRLTEKGLKFINELKVVFIKNLEHYDIVEMDDPDHEWMPSITFSNSSNDDIKTYCISYDIFQIYKGSKNDTFDLDYNDPSQFKEYDRTDFSHGFVSHFKTVFKKR
jgi:hypothetical protein